MMITSERVEQQFCHWILIALQWPVCIHNELVVCMLVCVVTLTDI